MNSENKMGITIEWVTPLEQRNYNNLVENVDFIVINPTKVCPVVDGSVVPFMGYPNYEWLLRKVADSVDPDYNIYFENIVERPTNQKDEELTNYNIFLTERILVRRTNAEIIAVIRSKENEANNSVLGEAGRNKLQMLSSPILLKAASGDPLDESDLRIKNLIIQVGEKAMINASNAKDLIAQVELGNTPNINQGWEYDNISLVGYPFE